MTKVQILKHLEWLKLYRSLLISGVANGAIKQILALKAENDRMRTVLLDIAEYGKLPALAAQSVLSELDRVNCDIPRI